MFVAKRLIARTLGDIHQTLYRTTLTGHRIVTFHAIETHVDGDQNEIYNMSRGTFESHVRVLSNLKDSLGIIPLTPIDMNGESSLAISFDDGYASTLTTAAPMLLANSIPFTVFVTPDLVMSRDDRYLDVTQLIELSQLSGVSIGAHGYRHTPLAEIDPAKRLPELTTAREWLENTLQQEVTSMSYPFGSTPDGICADVMTAGYSTAACSQWGFNDSHTDPLMLRRLDLWEGDSERVVRSKILGHWNWLPMNSQ